MPRTVDSQIACIPALPTRALQSRPRVLDMNIIRSPRCEERPAVVSKDDVRRSLFGRSFDVRGERLIEMYHHHHEQHNRVWSPRASPTPAAIHWAWAKRHISISDFHTRRRVSTR